MYCLARHPFNSSSHLHHLRRLGGDFLCSSSACEVNSSLRRSNSELIISLIVSKHANRSSKKRWAAAWRSCELFLGCFLFLNAVIDFPCLTMAKFGRFEPKWLALIGQKYALIGHFHFCRLALIGHGLCYKTLIMRKSSLKNASHVNKCKNRDSALSCFFSNFLLLENYQIWLLEKNELISHRTLPFWRLHAP